MTELAGMETLAARAERASYEETGTFDAPDGLRLFERVWHPPHAPRTGVVLVHGYAEHSGRYDHVAAFLNDHGYAVHAFDLRGHGRSEGRRVFVDTFVRYLNDLGVFLQRVRRRLPDVPLFLMGHSMGGTVCARFYLERRPALAGLVLSSPLLRPGADAPEVPLPLSRLASALLPSLPTITLDLDHLTRDRAVVAAARRDPHHFKGRLPARLGYEMAASGARILAHATALTLPFLVFHGTADRISDPRGSVELYTRARAEDRTLGLYEGLYHETLNEPERLQVLIELAAWLEEHL